MTTLPSNARRPTSSNGRMKLFVRALTLISTCASLSCGDWSVMDPVIELKSIPDPPTVGAATLEIRMRMQSGEPIGSTLVVTGNLLTVSAPVAHPAPGTFTVPVEFTRPGDCHVRMVVYWQDGSKREDHVRTITVHAK